MPAPVKPSSLLPLLLATLPLAAADFPYAPADLVFEEKDGIVAFEAEHAFDQKLTEQRQWYLTTADSTPSISPDGDPSNIAGASGGAYLEILPDTRRTHGDKLISGQNFCNEPGKIAILSYKIHFNTPGTYWIWARALSTTTEDNGLHFGIDGSWPETAQRWQTVVKRKWHWESKQRTEKAHSGVRGILTLEVDKPGLHTIHVSMREDGIEIDKFLFANRKDYQPDGLGPDPVVKSGKLPAAFPFVKGEAPTAVAPTVPLVQPRKPDGKGGVELSGDAKQWHAVTLTLDGPYAREQDNKPNPFTDCRMTVKFTHESGSPSYLVPGYFAADGDAANSSADSGTKWRAHLSPDKAGTWSYAVSFRRGEGAALSEQVSGAPLAPFDGVKGTFKIAATDKSAPDFRARGRLTYVGKHHLQFAGDKSYFLKAGADAPETLLGYKDFDGTRANNPGKVKLKTYQPHVRDWKSGDPSWKDGKGKGLVGALNYLSSKGMNAFSFLPYNAGGDGDNVWPFISRNDKFHYDCSKLDQWGIVFEHGTNNGLFLHFKMQETEMDDNRGHKGSKNVPTSLDGGDLGPQRKLYCRELIARYGHNLALNWNLGEENTQSTEQQMAMAGYIKTVDPYDHHIVVHTFPNQQEKVYRPLLGKDSPFTGASLQNSSVLKCHHEVVGWTRASAKAGKPWAIAFDEPGDAGFGMPPDDSYPGMAKLRKGKDGNKIPTVDQVRKYTLWGTLMAGGYGVEYYFGYKLPQNDLLCEDWRSRDLSWDYARHALEFFHNNKIPFQDMKAADELVGNDKFDNSAYCFADEGKTWLVYLPDGGGCELRLPGKSHFNITWFNPRTGKLGKTTPLKSVDLQAPDKNDWLAIVSR